MVTCPPHLAMHSFMLLPRWWHVGTPSCHEPDGGGSTRYSSDRVWELPSPLQRPARPSEND